MDELDANHNSPALSVSELSGALKRTIEGAFDHVRVRGEISGCKAASSGHIYFDLKDDKSLINAICWKGVAAKLPLAPENGMEVICTGRISTYAGRSNYQLIIEHLELSGAGALAALLEKRKQQYMSEGLFDPARKKPLPFLPLTIGVITSPTGAVIRDILHRLRERFPVRVLLWGVLVQGKGADLQIAEAINGFNRFDSIQTPPRPDLLIVARGGGSMEDLWSFNEDLVVRAAANSTIPIISAIGHETDFSLLDFVADKRAPTPTAAAEMAVPVRDDLRLQLDEYSRRLKQQIFSKFNWQNERLNAISRGLISPQRALEMRIQRLDEYSHRLQTSFSQNLGQRMQKLQQLSSYLNARLIAQQIQNHQGKIDFLQENMQQKFNNKFHKLEQKLELYGRILENISHQAVLKRGYAYLSDVKTGELYMSAQSLNASNNNELRAHLHDGEVILYKNQQISKPKKSTNSLPSNQLDLL